MSLFNNNRDAVRALVANIPFVAADRELDRLVYKCARRFVERVQVYRLTFVPNTCFWRSLG
jgi:hypothetical protein